MSEEKNQAEDGKLKRLCEIIDEAFNSGEPEDFDIEEFLQNQKRNLLIFFRPY